MNRLLSASSRRALPNIMSRPLAYSMRAIAESGLSSSAFSKCSTPVAFLAP